MLPDPVEKLVRGLESWPTTQMREGSFGERKGNYAVIYFCDRDGNEIVKVTAGYRSVTIEKDGRSISPKKSDNIKELGKRFENILFRINPTFE